MLAGISLRRADFCITWPVRCLSRRAFWPNRDAHGALRWRGVHTIDRPGSKEVFPYASTESCLEGGRPVKGKHDGERLLIAIVA
jgi:hypothetical protein